MKSLLFAALAAAAVQSTPPPSPPPPAPAVAPDIVSKDILPRAEPVFSNGVRLASGVRYWTPLGFRPLEMDVYQPAGAPARRPLVVFIHGGGWLGGDSHVNGAFVDFPGLLSEIAARGYVVASIDYRLSGEAPWPAQGQDVKAAIRYLRLNADRFGIDPDRVAAWGASAGGHLSAIAATTCGVEELEPRPLAGPGPASAEPVTQGEVSDCVQAAVSWFGVFDMATIRAQARAVGALSRETGDAPEWRLLGCFDADCAEDRLWSASPAAHVDAATPPMLLIVGDADRIVPHAQTLQMDAVLTRAGATHETHVLKGVGHDFLGGTEAATRSANHEAVALTVAFLDRVLKPDPEARGTRAP